MSDQEQKAWVVFSGEADLAWLKILRPGFRHCFVVINDGHHWITFDPLSNHSEIIVHHLPMDFDVPLWMQRRGYVTVRSDITKRKRPAPWAPFTCVEAVKRILGLHKRLIVTPWQLYRHLVQL